MRRVIVLTTLGVLVLFPIAAADGPKLVKQKLVLADDGKGDVPKFMHSARLSPDGKHLLYMRVKRVQLPARDGGPARRRRFYHLILRDLKAAKDKPLPVLAYPDDEMAVAMISGRIFGSGGKTIALGTGIDADGDGLHDYRAEKMQAVIYDIASEKLTKLPVTEDGVVATFDRTGKGLIIMGMSRGERHGKLLTTPLAKLKLRQLGKWGLPRGVCPGADVLAMLPPPDPRAPPGVCLVLYDLKADKQVAELPTNKANTALDDLCPQWTRDGRYLYYADIKSDMQGEQQERKYLTRVWDRTKSREAGIVGEVVPIGPGPGKTTMVVAEDRGRGRISLHDAATGAAHPLGKKTMAAITAEGKYFLYADEPVGGKRGIYMAEIVVPKKDKPAGKKGAAAKPQAVK